MKMLLQECGVILDEENMDYIPPTVPMFIYDKVVYHHIQVITVKSREEMTYAPKYHTPLSFVYELEYPDGVKIVYLFCRGHKRWEPYFWFYSRGNRGIGYRTYCRFIGRMYKEVWRERKMSAGKTTPASALPNVDTETTIPNTNDLNLKRLPPVLVLLKNEAHLLRWENELKNLRAVNPNLPPRRVFEFKFNGIDYSFCYEHKGLVPSSQFTEGQVVCKHCRSQAQSIRNKQPKIKNLTAVGVTTAQLPPLVRPKEIIKDNPLRLERPVVGLKSRLSKFVSKLIPWSSLPRRNRLPLEGRHHRK